MSHRMGWLLVVAFLGLGWMSWSMLPIPVLAGDTQETVQEGGNTFGFGRPAPAHEPTPKSIPAPPADRKQGIFDLSTTNKAEEKIQAELVDPQGVDIEFIDTPLHDVMQFLADAHDISILLDNQALSEEGVAVDEQITRTLSGITLASALKIILDPLGLTYVIEDEVLKVTTKAAANNKRFTRIYNTGYLQQIGIEPKALEQTIQTVIEPGAWQTSSTSSHGSPFPGGRKQSAKTESQPKNAINVLGDMLVVSAPQSVHKKINGLLRQLDRRWELQQGTK